MKFVPCDEPGVVQVEGGVLLAADVDVNGHRTGGGFAERLLLVSAKK